MEKTEYRKKKEHEKKKAKRDERKKNNQCVSCGKTDERTINGFTLCWDCREYMNARHRKWSHSERGRLDNRKRYKNRRHRLSIRGVCIHCGKNPAEDGKLHCTDCLIMFRELYQKTKEKKKTCG